MWGCTRHNGGRTLLIGWTETLAGGDRHYTGRQIEFIHPPVWLSVFLQKGVSASVSSSLFYVDREVKQAGAEQGRAQPGWS